MKGGEEVRIELKERTRLGPSWAIGQTLGTLLDGTISLVSPSYQRRT